MSFRNRILVIAAAAAVGAVAGLAAPASGRAAEPAAPNVGSWRFCSNCVEEGGDLSRYPYVGMNAWYHTRIPALKASNPNLKALVYKDMSSTRNSSCTGLDAAGVDYCWALQNHPDWFTLDLSGNRIEWTSYPGVWQMDVGTRAYQDQWVANVLAELRANGWDGVVIDNANVDQRPYLGGRTMSEYPTRESYQAATRSFLARVCPEVIAAGFLCLPNIQAHSTIANAELWADWIQFTSGGTREYWMKWGGGYGGQFGDGGWDDLQAVFATVQRAGKIYLPVTYAPMDDVRSMRFARASFLLGWNGGRSAFIFAPAPEGRDPWSLEWTADVGQPLGPRYGVGSVSRRDFSEGTVLVNRDASVSVLVDLGGTYRQPDGTSVTSITLPPFGGAVLRTVGAGAPGTPTSDQPTSGGTKVKGPKKRVLLFASPLPDVRDHVVATAKAASWRLSGRVVLGPPHGWRVRRAARLRHRPVQLYRRTVNGWRRFARVRTDASGRFRVDARFCSRRERLELRAAARYRGIRVVSPVVAADCHR